MYSGALLFFSHGQQNSAADLSMLVLESLEKAEVEVADELLENLAKVFSLMDPNSPERVAFVSRALKWSSGGSGKLGHPRLHQLLALTLWKEGAGPGCCLLGPWSIPAAAFPGLWLQQASRTPVTEPARLHTEHGRR